MQKFKEKVIALVAEYEDELAEKGIKIDVSKRYFEEDVPERRTTGLLDHIDRYFDKKQERKFKNVKNRYHCIVLRVMPIDKDLVHQEHCKDYSFVLRKVERIHTGLEPEQISYREDKILSKIRKRILKILNKAEKQSVQKVCKDNLIDVLRYSVTKYAYKRKVLGKDRSVWDMGIFIVTVIFVIAVFLLCYSISSLI